LRQRAFVLKEGIMEKKSKQFQSDIIYFLIGLLINLLLSNYLLFWGHWALTAIGGLFLFFSGMQVAKKMNEFEKRRIDIFGE
jgi:hypothetical protein